MRIRCLLPRPGTAGRALQLLLLGLPLGSAPKNAFSLVTGEGTALCAGSATTATHSMRGRCSTSCAIGAVAACGAAAIGIALTVRGSSAAKRAKYSFMQPKAASAEQVAHYVVRKEQVDIVSDADEEQSSEEEVDMCEPSIIESDMGELMEDECAACDETGHVTNSNAGVRPIHGAGSAFAWMTCLLASMCSVKLWSKEQFPEDIRGPHCWDFGEHSCCTEIELPMPG